MRAPACNRLQIPDSGDGVPPETKKENCWRIAIKRLVSQQF